MNKKILCMYTPVECQDFRLDIIELFLAFIFSLYYHWHSLMISI